jgi:hypothetical protein
VKPICALCGAAKIVWHHLTGRLCPDGPYLDPELVISICQRCHDREHVILRSNAFEWPQATDPGSLLLHRFLRVVVYVGRCKDLGRPAVFPDRSAAALHELLVDVCELLTSALGEAA